MPIDVVRDARRRRITATGQGEFRADEVIDVLRKMREDDAWTYGVLVDLRLMTGEPTIRDLGPIMQITADAGSGADSTRGPVAIVATNPVIYGISCAYAAMSKPKGRAEVFRDREDAERWLDERMPL